MYTALIDDERQTVFYEEQYFEETFECSIEAYHQLLNELGEEAFNELTWAEVQDRLNAQF